MQEQNLTPNETPATSGGAGSIFDEDGDGGGLATVASGPYAEQIPVGNLSVGEIRARFRDRFDIGPQSQAVLGGRDVDDDTIVRAGQVLMFTHRAGEKGMVRLEKAATETLTIEGTSIRTVSPEGKEASMTLGSLFEGVAGTRMDTCGTVLPDGIKSIIADGPMSIWVSQTPPRSYRFRWIDEKISQSKFGKGTKYREVTIALPYVIVLAVFCPVGPNVVSLSKFNECFFRTDPLTSQDDQLCYPALLNCSKFEPPDGAPLAWICTQYLDRSFDAEPDLNERVRLGFKGLMSCLFESGFNYSSEHHEASSWFTESTSVDSRIASVDAWQEATAKDPLFVLDVPWLKTGMSLRQVAERIFKNHGNKGPRLNSAKALSRFVLNHSDVSPSGDQPELILNSMPF